MTRERVQHLSVVWFACLVGVACKQEEPPGARPERAPSAVVVEAAPENALGPDVERARASRGGSDLTGTISDDLPFVPNGEKLASIAWRTWVYTDTGPKRTRYGYLRAGAVVDRRGPEIRNEGCQGGWYRINPRGFVCVGKGATLDLAHPIVELARRRPTRGEGLPYVYALSRENAPYLYFKLPTRQEMTTVEGAGWISRAATFRATADAAGVLGVLGEIGAPEGRFSAESPLTKPYGVEQPLRKTVTAGQASPESGFAIAETLAWEDRVFGLTTELDLVPLDRTKVVVPSSFHGVALGEGEDLPAAFVMNPWVVRYERSDTGQLKSAGNFARREGLALAGEAERIDGVPYFRTREGYYVAKSSLLVLEKRQSFPSVADGDRKWIDVSIRHQTLVAYRGKKAEYATLVSTGIGGLGDPEEIPATVRGTFMIVAKHVAETMDGEEDEEERVSDSFSLRDVPFVQYFHKGYALHGTYWHDEFGKIRSHGCINLSPRDSAWLFEWTDPEVPEGWHGVLNKDRGTVVYVHP